MKTVGIIGGMSWESTLEYYRVLNTLVREQLGGLHSARCIIDSVDFAPLARLMDRGEWEPIGNTLSASAQRLETAGADLILIATNTMHLLYDRISAAVSVPVLHIADATGQALREAGIRRVALLGTRFTMEKEFYRHRLEDHYGVEVVVPDSTVRVRLNRIIFDELCVGRFESASTEWTVSEIRELLGQGAEAVVLACTELPLVIKQDAVPVPLFDTLNLHCRAAIHSLLS